MKKIISLFLLISILLIGNAFASVRNVQDDYFFSFNYEDADGDPITGETITLLIKRVSDGSYFDFNDSTFKSSGWTSKTVNLSEDANAGQEHYYYSYNPPVSETGAEQYLFIIDDADATNGLHLSELVSYQDIGVSDLVVADNIGINWADVSNQGTSVNLSDTTVNKLAEFDEDNTTIDIDGTTIGTVTTATNLTTNNDKTGYTITSADKNTVVDLVWDEILSGHVISGSAGKAQADIDEATDGDQEAGVWTGIEKLIRQSR